MTYLSRLVFFVLVLLVTPAWAQGLMKPDPGLTPHQVIEIQLKSLAQNDTPNRDAGIAQTWEFAHPNNKRMTGPLERFKLMMKSPNYETMINHLEHKIEAVVQTKDKALFSVTIQTAEGQKRAFQWEVQKVKSGPHLGSWMTTSVSPPLRTGDST